MFNEKYRAVVNPSNDIPAAQCSPNPGALSTIEQLYQNLYEIYETTKYINSKFRPIKEETPIDNIKDVSIIPMLNESMKMTILIKDELRSICEVL